jgi:hypothetical protein
MIFYGSKTWAYQLTIIQGLSKEKQTFITRNNPTEKSTFEIFKGKKATFTADNVSIIATAIKVTNEFIQWEIKNEYTDVPFKRGDVVTMYDTTEYLWALNPEKAKRNFVKNKLYKPRRSIETTLGFTSALSESATGTDPQDTERGGYQVDLTFRNEFNINYSLAYGLRFAQEIINYPDSSLESYQFMGLVEARYYFDPMPKFYDGQIGIALGLGYGQTSTVAEDQTTTGTVMLLPMTKISLMLPLSDKTDMEFIGGFESLRFDESDATGFDRSTNLNSAKIAFMIRRHL